MSFLSGSWRAVPTEGRLAILLYSLKKIDLSLFLQWKIESLLLQAPKLRYAAKPYPGIMLMVWMKVMVVLLMLA